MNPAPNSTPEEPKMLADILRVDAKGNLFCSDGQDLNTYLAKWVKRREVTSDMAINLIRHDELKQICDDAWIGRHIAS